MTINKLGAAGLDFSLGVDTARSTSGSDTTEVDLGVLAESIIEAADHGHFARLSDQADRLVEISPKSGVAYAVQAGGRLLQNDPLRAVSALERALKDHPNNPDIQAFLGLGYLLSGQDGKAEEVLVPLRSSQNHEARNLAVGILSTIRPNKE